MASTSLSKTPSSAGNRKKFNFSFWLKGNDFVSDYMFFSASGSSESSILFDSSSRLEYYEYNGSSKTTQVTTNRVFRDPSAWYHINISIDTTQSTSSNRVKFYVNGVQETSLANSTYGSQNFDSLFNNTTAQYIGGTGSGGYFDGSMTHINFNDGYTYAPTSFGETDATSGIWTAKTTPSVTYGTNGFFLKMENASAMGTDSSGNSNTFTVSGSLTKNQDTPNNNFATFNPVYKSLNQPTYTQGNLTVTTSGNEYRLSFSSIANSTGKWYAEFKRVVGTTDEVFLGVSSENDVNNLFPITNYYLGETSKSVSISSGNGRYYIGSSATTYAASYIAGDIIGIALDLTNKKLYASKNGAWSTGSGAWGSTTFNASTGAIDISSIIASGEFGFLGCSNSGTSTFTANFGNGYFGTTPVSSAGTNASGNGIFEYDVPTGYTALSTEGLNS